MIEEMNEVLGPLLPLKIDRVESLYGDLSFVGDEWGFGSPSSWRVIKDGVLEFGWSHQDAPDLVSELRGLSIVSVASQSPLMGGGDPAFELSDGRWVEIFSADPEDPWWMRLPGITFVGSPSDPRFVK